MYPFALSGSIRIVNKNALIMWFEYLDNCVMYHPVPKFSYCDPTLFRVINLEEAVRGWMPCAIQECRLK